MSKIKLGSQSSLYPYPATVISVEVDGKKNFMQLGFIGIVNANPGMIGFGIGKHHHTTKAMEKGKVFALAIADEDMLIKADYVGIRQGDKYDKSKIFRTRKGDYGSNIIEEAPINLEVKILEVLDLGGVDYTIIAEILEVYAEEEIMTGKNPDIIKMNPIMLSMYENKYFSIGEYIGDAWRDGLEYEALKSFTTEMFYAYDVLKDNEYFRPFINENSIFRFDDDIYTGYQGFCQWLNGMRNILKVEGLNHELNFFDAKQIKKNIYEIKFTVETSGEMKDGIRFKVLVEEEWIVKKEDESYVFISYRTKTIG